jgi:hypothetical protein
MTFILAALLAQAAAPAPMPPSLSQYLLASAPYRLLTPADLVRERDYIEGHHLFSPFVVASLTGERSEDVVAVLVRRDGSKLLFAVTALHAKAGDPPRPVWVMKDAAEPILGVTSTAKGRLDVMKCYQCGSNPFYRWNGVEYQANLRAKGESVPVYHGSTGTIELRQDGTGSGKVVASLSPCTRVQILSVFPREGRARFYEVSSFVGERKVTGFVAVDAVDEMPCAGQ